MSRKRRAVLLALGLAGPALVQGSPTLRTASRTAALPQFDALQGDANYDDRESSSGWVQPRALLDASSADDTAVITQVDTFTDLISAIENGYQDIEITRHLDATAFGLIEAQINGVTFKHQLPPQTSKTRTIRGACASEPSADLTAKITGESLLELKPNQCLIISSLAVLPLAEGQVWLDNVYFRYANPETGEAATVASPPAPLHVHSGEAYITNVTIQGDGTNDVAAFWVFGSANVLMMDSTIVNAKLSVRDADAPVGSIGYRRSLSQASTTPAGRAPPVVAIQASPAFFLRTDFQDLDLPASGHVILGDVATNIMIQECSFTNVAATRELGSLQRTTYYSDDQTLSIGDNSNAAADPATPLPLSAAAGIQPPFLTQWDDYLTDLITLVNSQTAERISFADAVATGVGIGPDRDTPTTPVDAELSDTQAPSGTAGAGNDSGDDSNTSVLVGSIIAAAIVLVGFVAGLLWYFNKKQRRAEKERERKEAQYAQSRYHGPNQYGNYGPPPGSYAATGSQMGGTGWAPPPGKGGFDTASDGNGTNFSNASSGAGGPPGYGAPPGYGPPPPGAYSGHPHYGIHSAHGSTPSLNALSTVGTQPHNPFPQATMTATDFNDFTYQSNSSAPGTATRSSNARTRDPGDPVGPLADDASIDVKIERLHKQLDGMNAVKKPILSHYEVLSHSNRRQGGQGVVQFARGVTDQLDYAIKFFVSKKAFDEEGDFYKNSPMGTLLPKCLALFSNENGAETDAHGIPLPPFLIMEKGESLDEWSRRAKPDNFQAVAMLANIAKRLAHMHEAGFVHRDLKPGNVMWLPRENRWTVIDFGCVAKVGEPATICYSLRYTAPEVIQALDRNEKDILPDPAMDSWALGVMAYELLTGGPAFQILVDGPKQIIAQLKGEAELPWEGDRANPETMRKLRTLRRPIMALLERDPTMRPSLIRFCDQCDDIFGTRTLKG